MRGAPGSRRRRPRRRPASPTGCSGPGTVAIVPDQFPAADDRWYTLAEIYGPLHPTYPYRLIDDVGRELAVVQQRHLKISYYIRPLDRPVTKPEQLPLVLGMYEARPVAGAFDPATGIGAVRLVSGPGT